MSPDIAPEEAQAVRILWEKQGGQGEVPPEAFDRLLSSVRERKAAIEQHLIQDMLVGRIKEGRRVPRRHMIVSFVMFVLVLGAAAIVGGIISLFR